MPAPFVVVPSGTFTGRGRGDRVDLPDEARHHLRRVLRLRDGTAVVAADGEGVRARARITGDGLTLDEVPATVPLPIPAVHVWQALGKGRKHDEVVRVLTELGVDEITAVTSDRTVVDLEGKADRVQGRWQAVATAACEQARRPRRPRLHGPHGLEDLVRGLDGRPCLVAHVGEATDPLAAAEAATGRQEVVLAVGPEGGWTADEIAAFDAAGATVVGLGPTVLRTEHAATVLASIVLAAAGRMRP